MYSLKELIQIIMNQTLDNKIKWVFDNDAYKHECKHYNVWVYINDDNEYTIEVNYNGEIEFITDPLIKSLHECLVHNVYESANDPKKSFKDKFDVLNHLIGY